MIKNLKSGSVLHLESSRRVEEKAKQDDCKFQVKLDLRGFKAEDIKLQLRRHKLTVTGKHKSNDQGFYFSRDYSHRVLLPDDADLGSVTSRLSKNGLLIIEASRDPVLLPSDRNVEVSMEVDEQEPEEQAKQVANGDTEEQNKNWIRRVGKLQSLTCSLKTVAYLKILSRHKSNLSHAQVKCTSYNREAHSDDYISENFTLKRCLVVSLCSLCCFEINFERQISK